MENCGARERAEKERNVAVCAILMHGAHCLILYRNRFEAKGLAREQAVKKIDQ